MIFSPVGNEATEGFDRIVPGSSISLVGEVNALIELAAAPEEGCHMLTLKKSSSICCLKNLHVPASAT